MKFVRANIGWIITFILITGVFSSVVVFGLFVEEPQSQRAGQFFLRHFDGTRNYTEDYSGRPIILNFWAAWCTFCREEMPILEELYQKHKDPNDLVILGIHRSETETQGVGQAFADEVGVSYPLIEDVNGKIFRYYARGSRLVPATVFINREGFVEEVVLGPRSLERFESLLEQIL